MRCRRSATTALTSCPKCSGRLRKLFGSVGVVFKGSGFYRTDSREAAKSTINGSSQQLGVQHVELVLIGQVVVDKSSSDKSSSSSSNGSSSTSSAPAAAASS